jgi:hypothetical protein
MGRAYLAFDVGSRASRRPSPGWLTLGSPHDLRLAYALSPSPSSTTSSCPGADAATSKAAPRPAKDRVRIVLSNESAYQSDIV